MAINLKIADKILTTRKKDRELLASLSLNYKIIHRSYLLLNLEVSDYFIDLVIKEENAIISRVKKITKCDVIC